MEKSFANALTFFLFFVGVGDKKMRKPVNLIYQNDFLELPPSTHHDYLLVNKVR
jgi:hypothetical protein